MPDLIGTATAALDVVRRLREINKNIASAEFASTLTDLTMELSELKIQVASLLEENDRLKRELSKKKITELKFKKFAYFTDDDDGPFCPTCYDNNNKTIRLAALPKNLRDLATHSCAVCKGAFSAS